MPRAKASSKTLTPSVEIALLHKITHIIGSTLDLDRMLGEIVALVAGITRADACFIYLVEPGRRSLVLSASKTPHPGEIGMLKVNLGEGITGWVAAHNKPLAISEKAHEDPRFKFFQSLPEDRYEAFLSVPVPGREGLTGVINVQHRKPRRYARHELDLLVTLARRGSASRGSGISKMISDLVVLQFDGITVV